MIWHRVLTGTLVAATLAFAGTTPAVSAERAAPRTHIDPGTLPDGARPAIPYLDQAHGRLVVPGGHAISTKRFGTGGRGPDSELLHARGGYLLESRGRIIFLSPSGKSRVVTRGSSLYGAVVSTSGRWLVTREITGSSIPRRAITLRTIRISDGRVLDRLVSHQVHRLGVMAAGAGHVLVDRTVKRGKTWWADTLVWDPISAKVRRLDRRHAGPWVDTAASTATHRFVAIDAANRQLVLDTRTGHRWWRTAADERIVSFSPDDKRVVTLSGEGEDEDAPWHDAVASTVKVRSARTGAVLSVFTGTIGAGARSIDPVWESSTALLLHVTGKPYWDPEGESSVYPDPSIVRCSVVKARCARVPVAPYGTDLVVRKSN